MSLLSKRDEGVARLAAGVAAYALDVALDDIFDLAKRGGETVFARQLAIYLCHVGFELSLARAAAAFGRDRSTIAHAVRVIEDRRDEPAFDAWVAGFEAMLREAPPPSRLRFAAEARS